MPVTSWRKLEAGWPRRPQGCPVVQVAEQGKSRKAEPGNKAWTAGSGCNKIGTPERKQRNGKCLLTQGLQSGQAHLHTSRHRAGGAKIYREVTGRYFTASTYCTQVGIDDFISFKTADKSEAARANTSSLIGTLPFAPTNHLDHFHRENDGRLIL